MNRSAERKCEQEGEGKVSADREEKMVCLTSISRRDLCSLGLVFGAIVFAGLDTVLRLFHCGFDAFGHVCFRLRLSCFGGAVVLLWLVCCSNIEVLSIFRWIVEVSFSITDPFLYLVHLASLLARKLNRVIDLVHAELSCARERGPDDMVPLLVCLI